MDSANLIFHISPGKTFDLFGRNWSPHPCSTKNGQSTATINYANCKTHLPELRHFFVLIFLFIVTIITLCWAFKWAACLRRVKFTQKQATFSELMIHRLTCDTFFFLAFVDARVVCAPTALSSYTRHTQLTRGEHDRNYFHMRCACDTHDLYFLQIVVFKSLWGSMEKEEFAVSDFSGFLVCFDDLWSRWWCNLFG